MDILNGISIESQYDEGEIILFQAIYDVDFDPLYRFDRDLEWLADMIKKSHNNNFHILNDKSKGNTKAIYYEEDNYALYLSCRNFRVISTITKSEQNIEFHKIFSKVEDCKKHLERIIKEKFAPKKDKHGKRIDRLLENCTSINRIGIRLKFLFNRTLDHIRERKIDDFFNQNLSNNFFKQNDKIHQVRFKVRTEDENNKDGDYEKILDIAISPDIILNPDRIDDKLQFKNPATIDYIEGYFNPKSVELSYLLDTYNHLIKNILPIFSKEET